MKAFILSAVAVTLMSGPAWALFETNKDLIAQTKVPLEEAIRKMTSLAARRMGQKELINIASLNLPYIHSGVATRRGFARQNPEVVKSYLRGYIAAIKIANEDADASKRALSRYLVTNDTAILDEAYQTFRGIFPRVPYVTEDYIKSVIAVSDNPKAAGANPRDFFDNRYLQEIEDSGFVRELYSRR